MRLLCGLKNRGKITDSCQPLNYCTYIAAFVLLLMARLNRTAAGAKANCSNERVSNCSDCLLSLVDVLGSGVTSAVYLHCTFAVLLRLQRETTVEHLHVSEDAFPVWTLHSHHVLDVKQRRYARQLPVISSSHVDPILLLAGLNLNKLIIIIVIFV